MKRKVSPSTLGIAVGFVLIIVCVIIGYNKQYENKEQSVLAGIDFSGSSNYWHCALNISVNYNSELFIMPIRDDFTFPPTITVSVLYDQKVLSETLIQHVANQNYPKSLGYFKGMIDSEELTDLIDDMSDDYIDNPERMELWRRYRNRVTIKIQYGEQEFYTPVDLNHATPPAV